MAEDTTLLKEIFALQKESNERDTRIETQLVYMDKRLTKSEELLTQMSEVLTEQRHINKAIEDNQEILKNHETRITSLEQGPAKKTYQIVMKVIGIAGSLIITALVSALLVKLGLK